MITQEEFDAAKRQVELNELIRQDKIKGWDSYFKFIANKAVGIAATSVGLLEMADSSIISYATPHPEAVLAVGLSLLGGTVVLKVIKQISNSLGE